MSLEIDMAIQLIDEVASSDIEACGHAIRAGDQHAALAHADQAVGKLGLALDTLRSLRREPHELGVVLI